jgi:uncharacterized membrane protein
LSRKTIYFPHNALIFGILFALLVAVVGLVFFGAVGLAFSSVGFTPWIVLLILVGTLVGSTINIPILKIKTTIPMITEDYVSFFGVTYRIPRTVYGEQITTIAVNVGGALIPTAVSIYLLSKSPSNTVLLSLVGVAVVALVTYLIARPVKGVGIVTPAFIPPIAAAVVALLLAPGHSLVVAYVAGVLGTLIGADLLNLRALPKLGAPVASIGGAGTFDGVFLSGIIAVLLAGLK